MRGFLITVLLVLMMNVTSGQISIRTIPQHLLIDGSVTLSVTGITEELEHVSWYKGPDKSLQNQILTHDPGNSPPILAHGPLYNNRISVFNNGSLHIKDLRFTDGGNYIVSVQTVTSAKDVGVTLTVYDVVTKPKITASIKQPNESNPFTLTCNTSNDTTISWTKKDDNISSETKLSEDNRTLMFSSVKREDSGEYQCEAQNIASNDVSDLYTVTVLYGPDKIQIEGELLVKPGSPFTLTCSADSFPPPEYQWKINGADLEGKTSKYNISSAAPEDQGLYTCVARNPVTLLSATGSTYVIVTAASLICEQPTGLILGLTFALILSVVLNIISNFYWQRKLLKIRRNETETPQTRHEYNNYFVNMQRQKKTTRQTATSHQGTLDVETEESQILIYRGVNQQPAICI
ncbi:cell adhesion molecule CEACAM8-like isoform X2 [Ranitomeya variabilis]|uniref:cell adhesion molecule CEACAM8-like isoform X2 n=1 Tax=Ranitomeya variabilis TaxID=490064 RepID=UPI0040571D86